MFYTSLLQDLLRTNSVEINLFLYAENKYVRPLQQLLASLGFFTLPEKQVLEQTNQIFDHTLLKAIKKFNQKNKISGDGARLKAYSLWRMLQCQEIIPFFKTIDSYTDDTSAWQKETHFLYDPLQKVLSFLGYEEDTLSQSMERFCIYHGLIYPADTLSITIRQQLTEVKRLLKPGGIAYFRANQNDHDKDHRGDLRYYDWSKELVEYWSTQLGFEILEEVTVAHGNLRIRDRMDSNFVGQQRSNIRLFWKWRAL
jgi:hypothetical protein